MSQPNPSEYREPDPLQEFFEEAPAPPPEPSELSETKRDSSPQPELLRRLERAERQVDRALIDITTLRGDLATLVSAVDDIKKRMSRPPKPAVAAALPSGKMPWRRAIAAIVILMTAGTVFWGLLRATTSDAPEPPAVENESSSAVESPVLVEPPPAPAPVMMQTAVAKSDPPASDAPVRQPMPRVVNYVGTLTVDAEPGGEVYLDRQSVGRTPVRLENLRAGSHLIWIEREGYRRWTRVVPVAADRVSRVSASLDPISR